MWDNNATRKAFPRCLPHRIIHPSFVPNTHQHNSIHSLFHSELHLKINLITHSASASHSLRGKSSAVGLTPTTFHVLYGCKAAHKLVNKYQTCQSSFAHSLARSGATLEKMYAYKREIQLHFNLINITIPFIQCTAYIYRGLESGKRIERNNKDFIFIMNMLRDWKRRKRKKLNYDTPLDILKDLHVLLEHLKPTQWFF